MALDRLSVTPHSSLSPCPIFFGGEWKRISGLAPSPVYNPSRDEVISEVPMRGDEVVNDAVNAAVDAFPAWRDTPLVGRARVYSFAAGSLWKKLRSHL